MSFTTTEKLTNGKISNEARVCLEMGDCVYPVAEHGV